MSILNSEDDQIYVCGECGGEDVYEAVWMEINGTGGGGGAGWGFNNGRRGAGGNGIIVVSYLN